MTLFQAKAKLVDDMKLRNFSENTIKSYYGKCLKFLDFSKVKDTSRLTEKEFRAYLLHLGAKDLKASSINIHNCAVRFFYEITLEKDINYKRVPHMKEPVTRPEILTVDELTSFFAEVFKPKQFTFFLNLYGSGLRISEMIALRTSDIDGERMLLRVSNGNTLSHRAFDDLMDSCYQKDWVVYAKKPFGGVEGAFEYLGRYTHRIAISNSRIVDTDDNCTTFTWKDYKDNASMKNMTITNDEFIRRFLLHVLPYGFTRIRHYGLYSSRSKTTRLALYRMALAVKHHKRPKRKKKKKQAETPFEIVLRILGRNPRLCPICGMVLNQEALARASPA